MANGQGVSNQKHANGTADNAVMLSTRLHDEIRDLAALQWPEECCGLLIADQNSPNRILRVVAARNVAADPLKTFEIDPQALINTYRSTREQGEVVVGCFQSHPNRNALPSNRDRARADENGFLWMIVATDHTGARASGIYRAIHSQLDQDTDGDADQDAIARYFRRCKLVLDAELTTH